MIFPISIIANQWLNIHQHRSKWLATLASPTSKSCIGISPYFELCSHPTLTSSEHETLEKSSNTLKRREEEYQHMYQYSYHDSQKFKDSRAELERAKSQFNKQRKQLIHGKEQDLCTFESSKGAIALPITFDEATNIIALAQRGRIVDISINSSNFKTTITSRWPSVSTKRSIPLSSLRPMK